MGSDKSHGELKRLGFVMIIAMEVLLWISNLYGNAKKRSPGPLKSAVEVVERAANVVIALAVYYKFKRMSAHLLASVDDKVDAMMKRFEKYIPTFVKQFVNKAHSMAQKTLEVALKIVRNTPISGPRAAIHYIITLFVEPIMHLLAKFLFHKLFDKFPFVGVVRGVFGTIGE